MARRHRDADDEAAENATDSNWPAEALVGPLSGVPEGAAPAHMEQDDGSDDADEDDDEDNDSGSEDASFLNTEEGIFNDSLSLFDSEEDSPPERRNDHVNPVINRSEEMQVAALPRGSAAAGRQAAKEGARTMSVSPTPPPTEDRKLVAVFDKTGRPMVALTINKRQVESFRKPTKAEWDLLGAKGQIVRGGIGTVGADGTPGPTVTAMQASTTPKGTPTWMWALGLAAIAGGGYWWWTKSKAAETLEENTEVE